MRNFKHILAVGAIGTALALTGCGGGGKSATDTGHVDVLLTDAPLLNVNGKNFAELNLDITAFEASVPGSRTFNAVAFTSVASTVTSVNLLDLNNDQEWLAVANLPTGRYDSFRISVDPTTAELVEDGTSGAHFPLTLANPNGQVTFSIHPPLEVDPAQPTLLLVDWDAHHSVAFRNGQYVLSGVINAHAINRTATPIPFRALPARVASVNGSELRVSALLHSAAQYLVRTTSATAVVDEQGNTLQLTDIHAGDFVILAGTVDGNADIDADRIRRLPTPNHQPPGRPGTGGHHPGPGPGPGPGGNTGPGGPANPAGIVAAGGIIHGLTASSFTLNTAGRGPVTVTYGTATEFKDATVRPPVSSNVNILADGFLVEVVGLYVAPTVAGGPPTIDATHASGPGPNGGPGAIILIRR